MEYSSICRLSRTLTPSYLSKLRFLSLWLCVTLMTSQVHTFSTQQRILVASHQETEDLTCWTCPNKSDNAACNNWAPDFNCPLNHTVCKTIHRVNSATGESLLVTKTCAREEDCTRDMVGCHQTEVEGVKECISCCGSSYCNEFVPTNHSSAFLLSDIPGSSGHSLRTSYLWITSVTLLLWITGIKLTATER